MLDISAELWATVKHSLIPDDIDDVAERFVNILIEEYDAEDIREAFDGDKEILNALKSIDMVDAENWDEVDDDYEDDYNEDY